MSRPRNDPNGLIIVCDDAAGDGRIDGVRAAHVSSGCEVAHRESIGALGAGLAPICRTMKERVTPVIRTPILPGS